MSTTGNSGDFTLSAFRVEPGVFAGKPIVVADLYCGGDHVERFQWTPAEFAALAPQLPAIGVLG